MHRVHPRDGRRVQSSAKTTLTHVHAGRKYTHVERCRHRETRAIGASVGGSTHARTRPPAGPRRRPVTTNPRCTNRHGRWTGHAASSAHRQHDGEQAFAIEMQLKVHSMAPRCSVGRVLLDAAREAVAPRLRGPNYRRSSRVQRVPVQIGSDTLEADTRMPMHGGRIKRGIGMRANPIRRHIFVCCRAQRSW